VTVSVICRGWLLGTAPIFPVATLVHPGPAAVTLALIPGLTGGLLAIGATGLVYLAEDAFTRLPIHWMWWPAIGGLGIGIGGLFEPRALGVGYDVIDQLLTGRAGLSLILGILIVKTLIWSFSLGSGTSGGVLAPVFMIGGALGALEGHVLPQVFPGFWAMAGLAAVVGGVMRSPLTGIVFTLELTHAWNDLMPLLVASVSAYLLSVLLLKRSVLTEKIARRGLHLTREYSTDPLEIFFAREVMTRDPVTLRTDEPLEQVLSRRIRPATEPRREPALYPVVDGSGALAGILTHRELLAADLERSPARTVGELARPPRTVIHADQTLREVVNAFAVHSTTRAPVVDRADPTRLVGVVTLTQLLHARRQDHREEHHRQRHLLARPLVERAQEPVLTTTASEGL
jgi:CBS domain-containing protein